MAIFMRGSGMRDCVGEVARYAEWMRPRWIARAGGTIGLQGGRAARGFTLIEVLVVIAVIALLISLLLPALGKAKQMGRATVCLSNQAQIGLAMNMYADYFKGWIPREGTRLFAP